MSQKRLGKNETPNFHRLHPVGLQYCPMARLQLRKPGPTQVPEVYRIIIIIRVHQGGSPCWPCLLFYRLTRRKSHYDTLEKNQLPGYSQSGRKAIMDESVAKIWVLLLVQAACVCHPRWRTEANLAIVFTYFFLFFLSTPSAFHPLRGNSCD